MARKSSKIVRGVQGLTEQFFDLEEKCLVQKTKDKCNKIPYTTRTESITYMCPVRGMVTEQIEVKVFPNYVDASENKDENDLDEVSIKDCINNFIYTQEQIMEEMEKNILDEE